MIACRLVARYQLSAFFRVAIGARLDVVDSSKSDFGNTILHYIIAHKDAYTFGDLDLFFSHGFNLHAVVRWVICVQQDESLDE